MDRDGAASTGDTMHDVANDERPLLVRADAMERIYELQIRQTELQMQNDSLREAQKNLGRAHERYRNMFEYGPVAYLSVGPCTAIVEANRAAVQLFATARAALIGTRLSSFVAPEHVDGFARHRSDVRASDAVTSCRLELLLSDMRRHVRLDSVRIDDGSGEAWRVAIDDETRLRQLDPVTRDYESMFAVLDAAGLVVLLDAHSRLVRVNGACKRGLCDDRDVLQLPFCDVFGERRQRANLRHRFETLLASGVPTEWESTCTASDGAKHTVLWSATLLDSGLNVPRHMIVMGNDLTARKQLEARLLAADRLAALGTLAAGVGHEINNPLA